MTEKKKAEMDGRKQKKLKKRIAEKKKIKIKLDEEISESVNPQNKFDYKVMR